MFFIESSSYKNGNLQLSLYGLDANVNQISHFADITLNQNVVNLTDDTIIVDNKFKPTLITTIRETRNFSRKNQNVHHW